MASASPPPLPLLLVVALLFLLSCTALACSPHDLPPLLRLNTTLALHFPSLSLQPDCCNWAGITCDNSSDRRVIGVDFKLDYSNLPRSADLEPLCHLLMLHTVVLGISNWRSNSSLRFPPCARNLPFVTSLKLDLSSVLKLELSSLYTDAINEQLSLGIEQLLQSLCDFTQLTELVVKADGVVGSEKTTLPTIPACIGELRKLKTLGLSGLLLAGSIPPFLSQLRSLQNLDLSLNSLTGSIPPSLSQLQSLVVLDLSFNSLTGSIPPFLSQLQSLHTLYLDENSLTGSIPPFLSQLQSLAVLDLSQNSFSNGIPPSLSNLTLLYDLTLANNNLSGNVPPGLLTLPNLLFLDLSSNRLSGALPADVNTALFSIDFSNNLLQGSIPTAWGNLHELDTLGLSNNIGLLLPRDSTHWIFQLPLSTLYLASLNLGPHFPNCTDLQLLNRSIQDLDLSGNRLTQDILQCFTRNSFPQLTDLNLSHNPIQAAFPLQFTHLPQIGSLDLHSCQLHGALPYTFFGNFTGLQYLDLSENNLTGVLPHTFFGNLTGLYYLDLSENNLTGVLPYTFFGNLTSLTYLDLSKNNLTGVLPSSVGECQNLWKIKLGHNQLQGEIPAEIGNLTNLYSLSLPKNSLSGQIPQAISNCSNLQLLDLSDNQIHGCLESATLSQLSQLRILVLRSNQLNGSIPSWIGSFSKVLQIIDLSNNRLSGAIPQNLQLLAYREKAGNVRLGDRYEDGVQLVVKGSEFPFVYVFTALIGLDLSSNNLTAAIPPQLGALSGMIFLNLSRNTLTGEIPPSLADLHALESLDLSNNSLEGSIPRDLVKITGLEVFNVSYNNLSGGIPQGSPQFEMSSSYLGNDKLCDRVILNKSCFPSVPPSPPALATPPSRESKVAVLLGVIRERMSFKAFLLGTAISFVATPGIFFLCKQANCRFQFWLLFWKQNKSPSSSGSVTSAQQRIQELELQAFPEVSTESTNSTPDTSSVRHSEQAGMIM